MRALTERQLRRVMCSGKRRYDRRHAYMAAASASSRMIRDIQVALSDAGEQLADAERLLVLARLGQDEEP